LRQQSRILCLACIAILTLCVLGCAGVPKEVPNNDQTKHTNRTPPPSEDKATMPIPKELQEKISLSEALGGELYITDKMAAIGTDVMLENIKDPLKAGICGYTVLRDGDMEGQPTGSWSVKFFVNRSEPKIGYIVHISPPASLPNPWVKRFEAVTPPRKHSGDELVLFHAVRTAVDAIPDKVQSLNPVLMPAFAIGENGFLVYLLAGAKKDNTVVFGKHYRVVVSMDGRSANKVEPLTKSVLEVPIAPPKPDGTMPSLFVTHLLGDYPLETHVFISLQHHKTLYVGTEKYLWRIREGKISLVDLGGPGLDEAKAAYKKGDYTSSFKELKILADKGDSDAQYGLGFMYQAGKGVARDYVEAEKWYRRSADQDNAGAQFNLAGMYLEGEGMPQNYAEGLKWLRKAAELGYVKAQCNLGGMYIDGKGVPQDYNEAEKWLVKAAIQGDAKAQFSLGLFYKKQRRDYAEAAKWYQKAAEQGLAGAQCNLGAMYCEGQGVAQDYIKAHMWFSLSAEGGDAKARKNLDVVAKHMSPSQIAEAKRLAKEWKPKGND